MRLAILGCLGCCIWSVDAFACAPPIRHAHYDIRHDSYGDIGDHLVTFRCDDERLVVETEISIEVNFLIFELYKRDHRIREVWQGENLLSFESDLVEDGERSQVAARIVEDSMVIDAVAGELEVSPSTISSHPWPQHFINHELLFSIKTGELLQVQIMPAGEDVLNLDAQQRSVQKFTVSGDLDAELWYDDLGWLQARLPNDKDGSMITLTRR